MKTKLYSATYRVIKFQNGKYLGIAWDYKNALMFATDPRDTPSGALTELESRAEPLRVRLQWFEGHYDCTPDGCLIPSEAA